MMMMMMMMVVALSLTGPDQTRCRIEVGGEGCRSSDSLQAAQAGEVGMEMEMEMRMRMRMICWGFLMGTHLKGSWRGGEGFNNFVKMAMVMVEVLRRTFDEDEVSISYNILDEGLLARFPFPFPFPPGSSFPLNF